MEITLTAINSRLAGGAGVRGQGGMV